MQATRPGEEIAPGIRVSKSYTVSPEARLAPPGLLSESSVVEVGAVPGPRVVLADGVTVGEGAELRDCILWEGAVAPAGPVRHRAVITPYEVVVEGSAQTA